MPLDSVSHACDLWLASGRRWSADRLQIAIIIIIIIKRIPIPIRTGTRIRTRIRLAHGCSRSLEPRDQEATTVIILYIALLLGALNLIRTQTDDN